ncbi:MAG: PAS domain S-box protein [Thermoplasmatota archaeon]
MTDIVNKVNNYMNILFVDDEGGLLDQAKIFLKKIHDGFDIDTVVSVEKGLKKLDENDYDCIVSDYQMPKMDGLEFLKVIREKRGLDIPFIMFTGRGREEVAMKALNLGANRYLQKGGDAKSQYGLLSDAILQEVNSYQGEKAQERLSSIVQSSQNAIIGKDIDGKIKSWNKGAEEIYGYLEEEVIGEHISIIAPEDKKEEIDDILEKIKKGEKVEAFETRRVTRDGDEIYISLTVSPIFDKNDNVIGASSIAQDITERKEVERKLRKSEQEKSMILESTDEIISYHDKNHTIKWANRAYLQATGRSLDDLIGEKCYQAWELETICENCPVKKTIETGESHEAELTPDNQENWPEDQGSWLVKSSPVRDEDGNIVGAVVVALEISERRKAIEQLKKGEKRFKILFQENPEAVVEVDADFEVIEVNTQFEKLFKYDKEEILGKHINDLIVPEGKKEEGDELNNRSIQEGYFHHETIRKDKHENEIPVSITARPIKYSEETHHLAVYKDITDIEEVKETLCEMKERKERLVEGIKRYRNLVEASPDTILLIDSKSGKVIDANQRVEDLFKMSREEVINKDISELVPENEENVYEKLFEQWKVGTMYSGKKELHILDSGGKEVPVEIGTSSLELEGKKVIFGVFRNITKRKEAEKRQEFLHSLLRHDVRNKVSIVKGYHELIMDEDFDLPESVNDYISKAEDGIEESIEIIKKVSSLRKAQEEDVKIVEIDQIVKDVLDHTEDIASDKGIEITCDYTEEGQEVKGGSLLEQVFTNIIENAIQHSGCCHINIHSKSTEDEIIYTIEDNGKGISDEEKKKIFKKGYTTDEERGTGLGMFLVKTLLKIYEGEIEVKDSEMGGTKFNVTLKKA